MRKLTTPTAPELLTVDQTAEMLNLHRTTVYELIRSGELDSLKIGASRRIPRKAVTRFIAEYPLGGGAA